LLPPGTDRGDLDQTSLGLDVRWAHHDWIISGEVVVSEFETLAAGDLRTAAADTFDWLVELGALDAELSREGDAKLTGGVTISQGDRHVSADSATYDASERRFNVEGNVEFRSPELRLKGGSGSWNALGTGQFTGAEFEFRDQVGIAVAAVGRDAVSPEDVAGQLGVARGGQQQQYPQPREISRAHDAPSPPAARSRL